MGPKLRAFAAALALLLLVAACGGTGQSSAAAPVPASASDAAPAPAAVPTEAPPVMDRDTIIRTAIERTFIAKRLTDPQIIEGSYDETTNTAKVTADAGSCVGMTFDFVNGEVALPSFSPNTDAVQIVSATSRFPECGPVSAVLKLVADPGALDQPVDTEVPEEVRRAVVQVFGAKKFTEPRLVWNSYDPSRNSVKVTAGVGVCNLTFDYDHDRGTVGFPTFTQEPKPDTNVVTMLASPRFTMCKPAA